jgi:3-oxoacyl-[acyl-carrier protein] reductase
MKRVFVTGSSRGIGKAIALRLAADGYAIVTHAVNNIEAAKSVAEECANISGCEVQAPLVFDLRDREKARDLLEKDMQENGVYFGVVANAGIASDAPFPILEGDAWDNVIDTDLTGLYNVLKPVVMPMVSERIRGRIVALSSISGIVGNRGQVNYSAAKAGIIGAVKALAVELAKHKITVNAVAPGVIETDMISEIPADEVKKVIPMRRFGKPEEVAGVVAFLFREEAAYVTRQVISVNGGLC